MADKKQNDTTREPREAQSRERTSQRRPWAPPSALDAPEPPAGYVHRWVRTEVRGYDDTKNASARLREGWEPVRADEYPDFQYPSIGDGKYEGVIGVGGLVLARIPEELAKQREAYYQQVTQDRDEALENDVLKEQHPSMPINQERQTRVTFGGTKK